MPISQPSFRVLLLSVIVAAALSSTARADESTPEAPAEEPENGISARLLGGVADAGDSQPLVGLGVAYERDFFDNLIAVEVALEGLATPESQVVVAELVLEKPIELNDDFGFYFGGGPTVGVEFVDGRITPGGGGLALVGVEWFIAGGLEVFVELDTAVLVFSEPDIEADLGLGVLYRF